MSVGLGDATRRHEDEAGAPLPHQSIILTLPGADDRPRGSGRFEAVFTAHVAALGLAAETTIAVDVEGVTTSVADLERLSNRLARHLADRGVTAGDRVAILLRGTPETYAAMLAILKLGAAFVPLDAVFPAERIAFILNDSGARVVLATSNVAALLPPSVTAVLVDAEAAAIAACASAPLPTPEAADALCYVIYTSGTTGRPKGVLIDHAMLVNFVLVAVETYGIAAGARMYQGLTIAFDFSVEEIWVPLLSRATLVPAPATGSLVGDDLAEFLIRRSITALCCVPTLLASLEQDVPGLDFVLVSGEACPRDLISRWWRPGRTLLNAYGPTEATVTATLGRPVPGEPVTIGRPLPSYAVLIRDPETGCFLEHGQTGEIVLAGIGVSRGYLNRPDLTARVFLPDLVGVPHNASGRLYRTGDLGRVTASGEVEYLGRIDSQVKIRGYRIELTEIESVLMQIPGVTQAVVDKVDDSDHGQPVLAAWYAGRVEAPDETTIHAALRDRLPPYMVPAFIERIGAVPMLPSGKADRKALPPPARRASTRALADSVAPNTASEQLLAGIIAPLIGGTTPSVTADLFDALGLNSLTIARIATAVRRAQPGATLAMQDFYLGRTIRRVAERLDAGSGPTVETSQILPQHEARFGDFVITGALQLIAGLIALWLTGALGLLALLWVEAAPDLLSLYARSLITGTLVTLIFCILPIVLKWLLIGRYRPERFPVWSPAYFRFWLVKSFMRTSPLVLFAGTPLYNVYLRLLGARIGADALILSGIVPACPDLFEVGARAIVNRQARFETYRAERGWIETGSVTIGAGASVGDASVLEIDTRIGAGAALAHASTLQRGMSIPDGQSWHGTPAEPAPYDYRASTDRAPSPVRKAAFLATQVFFLVAFTLPLPAIIVVGLDWLGGSAPGLSPFAWIGTAPGTTLAVYLGTLLVGLIVISTVPRIAAQFIKPGRRYPLYGWHHFLARWISTAGHSNSFNVLFGDSSLILYFQRSIGVRLSLGAPNQTGSNFGLEQRFDHPTACSFGDGSMASDGLFVTNHAFSSDGFIVHPSRLGGRSFFGNVMLIPEQHRLGDNVLVATKALVPRHGPIVTDTGLLGSPSFAIPRSVARDRAYERFREPAVLHRNLARKLRSNLVTILLFLASRWLPFHASWIVLATAFDRYPTYGSIVVPIALGTLLVGNFVWLVALEYLATGFRGLEPRTCSIYEPYYWFHERYWKLTDSILWKALAGTPFKPVLLRLAGVKIGRMVFDDGVSISERSMTRIGDYATLNVSSMLQGHALEDGVFKSGLVTVGDRASVGVQAFIHHDTSVGEDAVIAANSFLMKGESPSAGEFWSGNPARRR